MKKFNLNIRGKILGGFALLIFIFIINALTSFYTVDSNDKIINRTFETIIPSKDAIDQLMRLVIESKMYITNWVYLQSNQEDKDALKELHDYRYPEIKERLTILTESWEDQSQKLKLDSVITDFEALIEIEKEIMASLQTFESYEDPMTKLMAEDKIETEILIRTKDLKEDLQELSASKEEEAGVAQGDIVVSSNDLKKITLVLGVAIFVIGLVMALILSNSITRPINYVKEIIVKLGKGELPDKNRKQIRVSRDEIGEIANAVDNLVAGLRATTGFAENIGKGEYQAEFSPLSEKDVLGNALLEMRDNLQKVADEDKKRSWATEGEAKFGEILRLHNNNVKQLCDNIIANLVKYLKANQGGLFLVQDIDGGDDSFMTLEACYAWDRKKYLEQKVFIGDGLAGQSWLEKDTIYITDVPEEYINITSGLGGANPTSILIVPLLVNENVYGVIEVASFNEFNKFEIEFVERIAESIASTISSVKVTEKTKLLLEEAQQREEEFRAQEEEIRQNNEELMATQEEMGRKQSELENTLYQHEEQARQAKEQEHRLLEAERKLQVVVDSIPNGIFWKDKDLKYLGCNQAFLKQVGFSSPNEIIGKGDSELPWKDQAVESMEIDKSIVEKGEANMNREELIEDSHGRSWIKTSRVPLRNAKGEVYGMLGVFEDITARKEKEASLEESMQQLSAQKEKESELEQQIKVLEEQLKTVDKTDKADKKA